MNALEPTKSLASSTPLQGLVSYLMVSCLVCTYFVPIIRTIYLLGAWVASGLQDPVVSVQHRACSLRHDTAAALSLVYRLSGYPRVGLVGTAQLQVCSDD